MDFAIERLHNVDKMRFVFDEFNKSYSCGRNNENMIICLSLLVSRRHCMFFRSTTDLYITDLKSANGVYINGELQKSLQMVKLKEQDIIGLGCSNPDPSNNTLYSFKVFTVELSPVFDKKIEISALQSTVLNTNVSPTISTFPVEHTLGKRCGFNSDCDKTVPNKKSKSTDRSADNSKVTISEEENNVNGICNNKIATSSSTTNISKTKSHSVDMETDDIEILYTIFNEGVKEKNIKDNKFVKHLDSNKSNFNKEIDIIIDENNKDKSKNINKRNIEVEKSNNTNKTNNTLNPIKNSNFVHSKDQIITVEDEQITDDEEASIVAVNTTCDTSLIKLKRMKYEPKTRFSEIDVIDLSDLSDEEVFPCSQLFDIKYEDNTEKESEIKKEYINNDDQNTEKIDLDVDDEVIFLMDSEDEDNPWLERLSRSQLLNEDKKFDTNNIIIKNEVEDLEISKEEVCNINTDYKKSENVNNSSIDRNSNNTLLTKDDISNMSRDDKLKKSKNNNIDKNSNNLLMIEMKTIDTNNVDPSNESSSKNTIDTNKQKTYTEQNTDLDKQTLHVENTERKSVTRKSVTSLKRLIPVIEPLKLPVRRSHMNCSKNKAQKVKEKSLSKSKKEKMSELKEKNNTKFYTKKQKKENCEKLLKSIDCHSSNEVKFISKDEKKEIIEKRKMKLRELAEEKKKLSAKSDDNIKRRTAKARVKVSVKNRGDFLINEQEPLTSKSLSDKSMNLPKSNTGQFKEQSMDKANMLKKSPVSNIRTRKSYPTDNVSKDIINTTVTSLEQSLQLDNMNALQIPKDNKQDSKVISSRERRSSNIKEMKRRNENVTISERDQSIKYDSVVVQKEDKKFSNIKSSLKVKIKKKVTFVEKPEIKEYQISENNSLKKLIGKDAPIPVNKLKQPTTNTEWRPKLEEFLLRIFKWNPVWLEEQRYLKSNPPIVLQNELQTMRLSYDSYEQYYKIVMPLLLLEIWCTMTKEFEMIEKNKQRATMMCSIVENPTCTPIPSTNLFLTTLKLEILVKKEEFINKMHPIYGDLVIFEYITNVHGKQVVNRIFAYVISMHQTIITNFTLYNQDLTKYVKNPYAMLTYTLLTRPLQHSIPVNRVQRVRTVMYLRANIRMVQALQYLPQSHLSELIVNPKIEKYQLPPMNEQLTCSSLVTKDDLNSKQMEALFRVTETVLKKEAKLCFIQGPPGTGKSKVIVNLVTQILHGEQTTKNRRSLRILVCAPSNAAIDEIVIRLLDIRSKLKKKRFNMVRIGRLECMHPLAKPVSVTELARRHLMKLTTNVEDTSILEAKINSLEAELATLQNKNEDKKKDIRRKLMEMSARYELLKCGKPVNELSPRERAKFQRIAENIMLAGADIIACTLSSCYTNQMESIFGSCKERISVCIVDEATQSCEAETLIPLMLGVKTLVLVGDPNQLPATILSQQAKKLGLDQSIFSRIQNVFASQPNSPIIMLNIQYRMNYAISYWPNKYFYNGRLQSNVRYRENCPFYAYRVLNHNFTQNKDKFSNTFEADFVANIIFAMLMFANWENMSNITIGILTPYNNQRTLVSNKINERIALIPINVKKKISFEVNTVDGFQGQERDIIIMSCVRSHGIGFLSDKQRLCVALTRAKYCLILCGNFNTFMKDNMWRSLLSDAQSRGIMCSVDANATPAVIKQFIIK